MKRKRFTEEQIIAVLREHEAGAKAGDLARKHGISEAQLRATFEGAGLGEFAMKDAARENMRHIGEHGTEMTWFVARGVKPL